VNADLYSCAEWGFDRNTKFMMQKLQQERDGKPGKVKPGIDWMFEPAINYYREKMKLSWLLPADRNRLTPADNYLYVSDSTYRKIPNESFDVLMEYKSSDTWLLRKK
jgi:hypothetical protein